MVWDCSVVATKSSNGNQSSSSSVSGTQLLTAQDEKLGFEAAVAALGMNLSVAIYCLCWMHSASLLSQFRDDVVSELIDVYIC